MQEWHLCRRKQRFSRLPGPRRPERLPSTGRVRCHYSPLLSYGPRRRPARHSPCRGSPSPARRQGWAQRARGSGGAGVREPGLETRPTRSWVQGRQSGALRSLAPPTSPPSTWRGEGRQWGGGPRPAARILPGYQARVRVGPPPPAPSGTRSPGLIPVSQPPWPQSSGGSLSGPRSQRHPRAPPSLAPLPTHTASAPRPLSPSNRAHAPRPRWRPPSLLAPLSGLSQRPRKGRKSPFPRAWIERHQGRGEVGRGAGYSANRKRPENLGYDRLPAPPQAH